jgi:hypothetical protein
MARTAAQACPATRSSEGRRRRHQTPGASLPFAQEQHSQAHARPPVGAKRSSGTTLTRSQCTPHAPRPAAGTVVALSPIREKATIFAALSSSGASRDRTGDLLLAKQISLSAHVSWCRVNACKYCVSVGQGRTRKDGARQTGAPLVPPRPSVTWGGGKRAARGLPGCVSSRMRPRPRPLLRRRSPPVRRAAACPRTRRSRGRRC